MTELNNEEIKILKLICELKSNEDIAKILFYGDSQVKKRIEKIYKKLNITTKRGSNYTARIQTIYYCIKNKIFNLV